MTDFVEVGCQHFIDYKKKFGVRTFTLVHGCFSSCVNKEARNRKALSCLCFECGNSGPSLFSCLHCIYFGCKGQHISNHLKEKDHTIALELGYGTLYCSSCDDYIYDSECRKIADGHLQLEATSLNKTVSWRPWSPDPQERSFLFEHQRRRNINVLSSVGIRGLINLGATCFMNCIVQALTHTPMLRDYFLSESHACKSDPQSMHKCLECEITTIFQDFYSKEKGPLSLHRLLHLIWNHARHLAAYEQQDAHEFFMATLDVLHTHYYLQMNPDNDKTDNQKISGVNHHKTCNCIIDRIFSGHLQSDVVCQACNGVSTTIDPIWDISLDLVTPSKENSIQSPSLYDCLERFTRPEHLGSGSKIKCSSCEMYQESTKQLKMRTLPIVASFHLKRFDMTDKKISTFISFPAELDMTPFMSQKRLLQNDNESDYRYSLYAVINHEGTLESGHYTAYVRLKKDVWVKCDDHVVTPASLSEVLESQGYLLFYHKKILEYK